jgi:WD40 repeat protein/tetratricopeptide (TPR) repeat protein
MGGTPGASVRIVDLHDPGAHWTLAEQFTMPLVEVSPDGRLVGVIDRNSADHLHVYSLPTGKKLQTISIRRGNHRQDQPPGDVQGTWPQIMFSPDSKRVAVVASHQLCLGNTDQPQVHTALARTSHQRPVHAVAVSPDGQFLASAGDDGTVCFWRTRDGGFLGMLDEGGTGPSASLRRIVFSPRGTLLALRKDGGEIAVWKWSRATGEDAEIAATFLWSNARAQPGPLAFSPDGTLLAAGEANGGVRVIQADTARIVHWLLPYGKTGAVQGLAFTPDGKHLATARGPVVALWDVKVGSQRLAWDAQQGPIRDLACSHDGRFLLTTGKDVRLWSAATGVLQLTLDKHSSPLRQATFSPSGRRLAVVDERSIVLTEVADLLKAVDDLGLKPSAETTRPATWKDPLWTLQTPQKIADENIVIEFLPRAASAERARDWKQAVAHLTRLLAVEPDNRSWRERRSAANEQRKDWRAVAVDRSYFLDRMPDDRSSHSERSRTLIQLYRELPDVFAELEKLRTKDYLPALVRGRALVLQSRWQDARAAYASVIQIIPASEDWYEYAALCLLSGDRKAHDDHVAWMAKQKDQPNGDFIAYCYARAAGLAEGPRVDRAQIIKWGELAVSKERRPWYLHAAGMAYYRAGQLDKARETLQVALKGAWGCQVLNQLALGLVEHKLGNDKAARDLRDAARKWRQDVERGKTNGYVNVMVPDWVEFNVLMPELESLLAKSPH